MFKNKTNKQYKEVNNAITCDELLKKDNTSKKKKPTDNQIALMKSETVKKVQEYRQLGRQAGSQSRRQAGRQGESSKTGRRHAGIDRQAGSQTSRQEDEQTAGSQEGSR